MQAGIPGILHELQECGQTAASAACRHSDISLSPDDGILPAEHFSRRKAFAGSDTAS